MKKQIESATVVRASGDQMSCDLDGEAAVLHLPSGVYFGLDEVGARIWKMVQSDVSVEAIQLGLLEEYEIDSETCAEDVRRLLGEMWEVGLVEIVEGGEE